MMSSNENFFSMAICAGNSLVTSEFPTQRPVMWSFDVFFDLRLNKRLSKQSWGWWFEMPLLPLWRHSNVHPLKSKFLTNKKCSISWELRFIIMNLQSNVQYFKWHHHGMLSLVIWTTEMLLYSATLFNTLKFSPNIHAKLSIACPHGQAMRCLLWVNNLVYVLLLPCYVQYHITVVVLIECVIIITITKYSDVLTK